MKDRYESPLSSRYASEFMLRLFSADMRIRTWRRLWVALARAEHNLGLPVTAEQVAELEVLLPTFSAPFRKLYEQTPLFNGGKWLVVDVKRDKQLEEVQRLILMKAKPVKKEA